MAAIALKRSKIPYKYAVGIALKNCEKLLSKEIYNFILVHMPKVCTLESNNWENAVRNALVKFSDMFVKIQVDKEKGKPLCFYTFAEGGLEQFNNEFSEDFGFPYDFLAKPGDHHKLYNGEMIYPTPEDIDTAKARFKEEQKRWAALPKELKETKKSRARKTQNAKNQQVSAERSEPTSHEGAFSQMPWATENKENYFYQTDVVGVQNPYKMMPFNGNNGENFPHSNMEPVFSSYDYQMTSYDYGYQQMAPGPIRSGITSYQDYRMNPYNRFDDIYHQQPMSWEQSFYLPPAHLDSVQMPQMAPMDPLDLQPSTPSLPLIQEEDFQQYLGVFDAPIADENNIFDKYFPSPNSNPPQVVDAVVEPVAEPTATDDSDPSYWFVM